MTIAGKTYTGTVNALVERIDALVAEHPEVLQLDSAWGLFKIPGFNCNDLGPSLAQAQWALGVVQQRHR